jgi:CxxC motif-containing protein (DUF1111 family)
MNLPVRFRSLADAFLAVSLFFLFTLLLPAPAVAEEDSVATENSVTTEQYGRAIFVHEFEVGKGVTSGGDGLGPVFNHRSCVGCHSQGGAGGGGPIDVNVQILAAERVQQILPAPPAQSNQMCATSSRRDFRQDLVSVHPLFSGRSGITRSILLHRFGTDERYAEFRAALGGVDVPLEPTAADRLGLAKRLNASPVATVKLTGDIHVQRIERNTPSLFGAGLIDQIPDEALHGQAYYQEISGTVSGRVPPVGHDRVGRFGWRGQTEHLSDFVRAACANELGLEVPGQKQPRDPFKPNARFSRLDLTEKHCDALTTFVASLPRPEFIPPDSDAERDQAEHGHKVFHSIGCTACHVRKLDSVDGIYSDLLLHDLGSELADPAAAEFGLVLIKREDLLPQEAKRARAQQSQSNPNPNPSPYGGGTGLTTLAEDLTRPVNIVDAKAGTKSEFRRQFSHVDREWRTPPLWGVADSAPYMHDGRAATLNEAISLHGGEAAGSKQKFFESPEEDRLAVVAFLKCLRAPQ